MSKEKKTDEPEVTTTRLSLEDLMKESNTGPLPIGGVKYDEKEEPKKDVDLEEKEESEEEVEPKKEKEEPKKKEEVKDETSASQTFKETLTLMYGESFLSNTAVGEEEDNTVLADIEITPEVFRDIINTMTEDKIAEATEETVSLKGADGQFKELLEIAKNGGDVQELIRIKVEVEDQVNSLDFSNKADQQSVIVMAKKMAGFSDKDITRYMKGLDAGELLDVAEESKSLILRTIENHREAEKKRAQEEVARKKELAKKFKSELSKNITENFDVKDGYKKKLIEIATKSGDDGMTELDNLFKEAKHNPKLAPELILFLTDREEFKKQVSSKEVLETKKKSIKLIRKSNQVRSSGGLNNKESRREEKDTIIPLENLGKK